MSLPLSFFSMMLNQPSQKGAPENDTSAVTSPGTSKNSKAPKQSKSSADTLYKKTCILSGQCSKEKAEAALYDYVGAVYSEYGVYDGVLNSEEREYVKNKFGLLDPQKKFPDYLSAVRKTFFAKYESVPNNWDRDCNLILASEFPVKKFSSSLYGQGIFIGSVHYCGERVGQLYADFELEVAARPEEWVFFLEGSSDESLVNNNGEVLMQREGYFIQEFGLFQNLSRALKISLKDPVLTNWRLVEEIVKLHPITKEDFVAFLVYGRKFGSVSGRDDLPPFSSTSLS